MAHDATVAVGTNQTGTNNRVQLRKTLTLVQVVMMGLAYLQPMTIFDTFGIVSGLTDGHVATSYAIALIAVLFTAVSYGKLVKRFRLRAPLIPTPRNPSARMLALWWVGHHCWTTCSCR